MTHVTFLKEKYEAFEKFKSFKPLVENETHLKNNFLGTNKGCEFISHEFNIFFEHHAIRRQLITARNPH